MATEKKATKAAEAKKSCFIIMPITTPKHLVGTYGGDKDHFVHVLKSLFVPAVEAADFEVIPPEVSGSAIIQAEIINNLKTADLVLCDMSSLNANVFFELGIRTALNLPVCMVRDKFAPAPFDIKSLNYFEYSYKLEGWEIDQLRLDLKKHIQDTEIGEAVGNPLWRHYSLATAEFIEPAPGENGKYEVLAEQFKSLKTEVERLRSPMGFSLSDESTFTSESFEESLRADEFRLRLKQYFLENDVNGAVTNFDRKAQIVTIAISPKSVRLHKDNITEIVTSNGWTACFLRRRTN